VSSRWNHTGVGSQPALLAAPFTQQDPIGIAGGLNLYGYANGDPVNLSDPSGLCPEWLTGSPCPAWADIGAGFVPGLASGVDGATLLTGEDPLTGEKSGLFGRVVALAGLVTPATGGEIKGAAGTLERLGAKIGRIASNHLNRRHLSIAARELRGLQTGWDHVTEVREAAAGMRNVIGRLNRMLGNPNLDPALRGQAEDLLGRASRALDEANSALRR